MALEAIPRHYEHQTNQQNTTLSFKDDKDTIRFVGYAVRKIMSENAVMMATRSALALCLAPFRSSILLLGLMGVFKPGTPGVPLHHAGAGLVPLCPAIAEVSSQEKSGKLINYSLSEAEKLRLKVRPLSSYTAIMQTAHRRFPVSQRIQVHDLRLQSQTGNNDKSTYLSCMRHAQTWINIVVATATEMMLADVVQRTASLNNGPMRASVVTCWTRTGTRPL